MRRFLPFVLLVFSVPVLAQKLNTSFNPLITSDGATIKAGAIYSDGRVIVAGDLAVSDGERVSKVARLLANGKLDKSFSAGSGFDNEVDDIEIQADGKIVVTGEFENYNGVAASKVIRLNSDGTVDNNFATARGTIGYVNDMAIQPDGKIIIAGSIVRYNDTAVKYIVRLNPDGSLDNSFKSTLSFSYGAIFKIAVQLDGKIIIAGSFVSSGGQQGIMRLNADGTIDTSFNKGGTGTDWNVYDVDLQEVGGKQYVLVCGVFDSYNGVNVGRAVRLKEDGSIDTSFSTAGFFGGNVVVRVFSYFDYIYTCSGKGVFRHKPDGSVDTSFGSSSFSRDISWIDRTIEGDIFCNGVINFVGGTKKDFVKTSVNGSLINTFDADLRTGGLVSTVVSGGNDFIVGGVFDKVNNIASGGIVKLKSDGTIDNSFQTGTGFKGDVATVARQADGKLIVGGNFTAYNGTATAPLIRLNSNGSKDAGFSVSAFSASATISKILVQSDGKIIVLGSFTTYGGTTRSNLIRLNSNGSLDASFNTENLLLGQYRSDCLLQPDGGVLVAYYSNNMQSSGYTSNVKRFLPDGSLDAAFGYSDKIYMIQKLAIHDNNIYAISTRQVVKMNLAGEVDNSYKSFIKYNSPYSSSQVKEGVFFNNSLFVGGSFDRVSDDEFFKSPQIKTNAAMLALNGACVPGFTVDANGAINQFIPISATSFVIAGSFSTINSKQRTGMAWLDVPLEIPAAPSNGNAEVENGKVKISWTDNSNNESGFELQRYDKVTRNFYHLLTTKENVISVVDTATNVGTEVYMYSYRLRAVNAAGESSFIDVLPVILDAEKQAKVNGISVYPNPVKNIVNVELSVNQEAQVEVIDVFGKTLLIERLAEQQLDVSALQPGVYFLRVKTKNTVTERRIVKGN